MGKEANRNFQMFPTPEELIEAKNYQQSCFKITEKSISDNNKSCDSSTSVDSTKEGSNSSIISFSSSDLMEDATSSSSSSSSSSNGPLYQLSDLMDQLPIKRGLSKYYHGKSESFTSLASVGSLEDLVKRENPYRKRIKLCRSYCGGFDGHKFFSPKPTISKKASYSRNSYSSSILSKNCSNNLMTSCRPFPISPVQKDF